MQLCRLFSCSEFIIKVDYSSTQSKKIELTHIFPLYLTIFISAVQVQWSESRDLVWSRDTRRGGSNVYPQSLFNEAVLTCTHNLCFELKQ